MEVIAASLGLRGAGRGLVFGEFIVINRLLSSYCRTHLDDITEDDKLAKSKVH
jgi:hypothetical protein